MSDEPHIMIAVSKYYEEIADQLLAGALAVLDEAGASHEIYEIPGAFEIPAAIATAMRSPEFSGGRRRFDGYVALGCVIRGETDHYDHICREASRALMEITVDHCFPLGFAILTCENMQQAEVRADPKKKNKGAEAARAVLRMIELRRYFQGRDNA